MEPGSPPKVERARPVNDSGSLLLRAAVLTDVCGSMQPHMEPGPPPKVERAKPVDDSGILLRAAVPKGKCRRV